MANFIDTDNSKYASLKQDDYKSWEAGVQGLCAALNIGTDEYYRRRLGMYRTLMASSVEKRSHNIPTIKSNSSMESTIDYSEPWMFQTLPGVLAKPSSRWFDEGKALNDILAKKDPLGLAHEPLEILNGGPEFYQNLSDFLRESATSPQKQNVDQSEL